MDNPTMLSGYCFELEEGNHWQTSSSEPWETVIGPDLDPAHPPKFIGRRVIDDAPCAVWRCHDGKYRAQVHVAD